MEPKTYMRRGVGRARRRKLGILQADLARALGVAVPTVSNWEVGRHPIPWHRVEPLAQALGGKRGLFETRPGANQ